MRRGLAPVVGAVAREERLRRRGVPSGGTLQGRPGLACGLFSVVGRGRCARAIRIVTAAVQGYCTILLWRLPHPDHRRLFPVVLVSTTCVARRLVGLLVADAVRGLFAS